MADNDDPPRLSVVAAIVDAKTTARGALRPEARLGTRFGSAAESETAASATPSERELAKALQGGQRPDSQSAIVRHERTSAFAGLYRKFALHQLNSQVRNKAAAILVRLSRP